MKARGKNGTDRSALSGHKFNTSNYVRIDDRSSKRDSSTGRLVSTKGERPESSRKK